MTVREIASSSAEGCGRERDLSSSAGVWGSEGSEYADLRRLEAVVSSEVEGRLVVELELLEDLSCALHAASRDLAAFSSEMAVESVGRSDEAISDILQTR